MGTASTEGRAQAVTLVTPPNAATERHRDNKESAASEPLKTWLRARGRKNFERLRLSLLAKIPPFPKLRRPLFGGPKGPRKFLFGETPFDQILIVRPLFWLVFNVLRPLFSGSKMGETP